ncbi:MAG: tetratricopeptide repeat protein [Deltaproteobacteria bacterium]|nr:tetratricopeptide repeat protein [Deltaproteobacteria bacterium]
MRAAAIGAAALLLGGCAAGALAPRKAPDVALEEEEKGMWHVAAEAQVEIDRGGRVAADPALEAYLASVGRRLVPPAQGGEAIPFRFRALRDPRPNAFCLPNGAIYVASGMLARMESEAELAALLGHEMAHAIHRHALRELRTSQNTGAVMATLGAMVGAGAQPGGLIYMASVSGYSRDMEREADREGLALATAAGYDATLAPHLFERLRDFAVAEKLPEGSAYFASHPRLEERIASMREALAGAPSRGEAGAERYRQQTARLLLENARIELGRGRLANAREQLGRFQKERPGDAAGHLALGELERREGGEGSAARAAAAYRKALEIEPRSAEAWRGLGLVLQRSGQAEESRRALRRYLELAPAAPDRAHVEAALQDSPGGKP